jgi:uncharacterized membrane protein
MNQNEINRAEWNNPENWAGPKAFAVYFSKRDSRTVVPKRLTWMGWTVNLARTAGVFWLMGVLVGIPLAVMLIVIFTDR